jgi:hypothetical protein
MCNASKRARSPSSPVRSAKSTRCSTFPLERAAEALRQLKDRKALGRVVLIVDPRLEGTFE